MSRDLADLNSKLLMIEQLHSQNLITVDVYLSQTRDLQKKINELKGERLMALNSDLSKKVSAIKDLLATLSEIDTPVEEFDETLFEKIVEKITIGKKDNPEFVIKGELKFTENL